VVKPSQVVIVTGAGGSGCGRAIASRFATDGAAVVVSDINDAGGQATVERIARAGGEAAFCRADVRDEAQVRALIAFAESTFGRVSALVNNASSPEPAVDGLEGWTESLQTDLMGTLYATRWAIEAMRRTGGGSIVNISSISALRHGRRTPGGFHGYDVAKAGVIRITTSLAVLAEQAGIRVNCLAPGWIATGGALQYWESLTPAERKARGVPAKLLQPEDVADVVVRLATDESLTGRIVLWWSDDSPRIIEWGDRGYREAARFDRLRGLKDHATIVR
jgi:NAD(P)-dependent dehydrogenase (short-subunit alcohol dehydrogenase family)